VYLQCIINHVNAKLQGFSFDVAILKRLEQISCDEHDILLDVLQIFAEKPAVHRAFLDYVPKKVDTAYLALGSLGLS
jgi:hypothetical protein